MAIRLDSAGPLFFRKVHVGENGRLSTCWKFRSMYRDGKWQKRELLSLKEMAGSLFEIRSDPRFTRVGKFLRRTSLDELPQFWNVLRVEMSLVETRPPTPDEVSGYEYKYRRRICTKPGITGLWQVSGRNHIRSSTRWSDPDENVPGIAGAERGVLISR
jgi:lipopolysaccharide/colanic/teichoic acid biosynthesis glycosyltransferase